jgi:hypothetical protein
VQDIPPRELAWKITKDTQIGQVLDTLEKEPEYWFIPIVSADGKIENVIEKDAIWLYYQEKIIEEAKKNPDTKIAEIDEKLRTTKISTLLEWADSVKEVKKFKDQYVSLELDHNVIYANDELDKKDVSLAVISDDEGKAKYFITTGDIRRTMARLK